MDKKKGDSMLKGQIASVATKPVIRLVALLIVASAIVGSSMITTTSAAGSDTVDEDINDPPSTTQAATDVETENAEDTNFLFTSVDNKKRIQLNDTYISLEADVSPNTPARILPSGTELVDHAANNTDGKTAAPSHPQVKKAGGAASDAENETDPELVDFVYVPEIPLSEEVQQHAYKECSKHDLVYSVVLALMWRESRFKINAVGYNTNGTRDHGVMQINDVNKGWLYQELGIQNLMDPEQNITAGTEMLGRLRAKHGMHNALMAYQYGEQGMLNRLARGVTTNEQVQLLYTKSEEFEQLLEKYQNA